jgi:hypothetical protein
MPRHKANQFSIFASQGQENRPITSKKLLGSADAHGDFRALRAGGAGLDPIARMHGTGTTRGNKN